jgi:DNA-directed RNA polymerase specialized sigma24 family protein
VTDPEYDITARDTAGLLAGARMAGRTAEAARQTMLEAAAERQRLLLVLHNMGMSIRDLARELDVAPTVIAAAINRARAK